MTERSQRRAAERKAKKQAGKAAARQQPICVIQSQTRAMAQGQTDSEPLHPTQLDPVEESLVEISDTHARRREHELQDFLARIKPAPDSEISEAQLAANRANAQLSSGPTSTLGKSISSRNNLRHGLTQSDGELILLESESKDEYLASLASFQTEWKPKTATENDLVNRLACHQWLRRRALKLQARYVSQLDGEIMDLPNFTLYRRYESIHDRAYNKAFSDLLRLRALRVREQNGFESQRRKDEEHKYKIRTLKHRETIQELAVRTAEIKLALFERKLTLAKPANPAPMPETIVTS